MAEVRCGSWRWFAGSWFSSPPALSHSVATRFPLAHPPFPSFTLLWPATVFVSLILSHVTVNQTFSAGHGLDGEHTVVDLGEVRRVTVPRHLCALSPALACTLLTMVVIIISDPVSSSRHLSSPHVALTATARDVPIAEAAEARSTQQEGESGAGQHQRQQRHPDEEASVHRSRC